MPSFICYWLNWLTYATKDLLDSLKVLDKISFKKPELKQGK